MRNELRILCVWFVSLAIMSFILLLPHGEIDPAALINTALQLLLCLISSAIAINTDKIQRYVYINLGVLFGFSIFSFASNLYLGKTFFIYSPYFDIYYNVYINKIGLHLLLLFTISYVIIDGVACSWKTMPKYLVNAFIAISIILIFFFPYIINPLELYYQPDYILVQQLKEIHQCMSDNYHREPTEQELATEMISTQKNAQSINSSLTMMSCIENVRRLHPFIKSNGKTAIFWKPLNQISIYINVILVISMIIFVFYSYNANNSYPAYIDKILILFILFCFLEMFHRYGYTNILSSQVYQKIFTAGQYFTILCLILMIYTFGLKYRFVCSATGRYYERLLRESPGSVTRWRDEIDNLILNSFFVKNKFSRRIGQIVKKSTEDKGNQKP